MERLAATGDDGGRGGGLGDLLVKSEDRKNELSDRISSVDGAVSAHIQRMKRNQATAAKRAKMAYACRRGGGKGSGAGVGAAAAAAAPAAAAAAAAAATGAAPVAGGGAVADNPQGCECCKPEWLLDQETLDKLAEMESESNPFAAADFGGEIGGGVRSRGGRKALDEEDEYDRLGAMRGLGRG